MPISIDDMALCGIGADPVRSGYGPSLKQRFDCAASPLTGTRKYAAIHLPKGFVPRHAVLNVIKKSAGSATLSIGTNQTVGAAQVVYEAAAPLSVAGLTLANAETGGKTIVKDDDWYLVIIPSANVGDAVFDVVVMGDWTIGEWDARTGDMWPPAKPPNVIG